MKSLIVTGGANGLGRSIAESASKAGYRVGILDVNIGALEEAVSSIENATPLVASVTSTAVSYTHLTLPTIYSV